MSATAIAPLPLLDSGTPLGATIVPEGVTFRAWAPSARHVFVLTGNALASARTDGFVLSANNALVAMGDGTWGALLPRNGEGDRYMFWVDGVTTGLKRDPRARELTPDFPKSDCLVRSPSSYAWHDQGFRLAEFRDLVLYQIHVGVFYGVDANGHDKRSKVAKFLDILDRVDYLRDLGVNAIQLMPIQEFPSESSMGYNGVDLFSPEMAYTVLDGDLVRYVGKANALLAAHGQAGLTADQLKSGPNQLKCLIDILHLNGMGVLFDLVYNHAGGGFDDFCLYFFDRQATGDNNRSLYFTDQGWVGGLVFAY